jgi:hypothetical protein
MRVRKDATVEESAGRGSIRRRTVIGLATASLSVLFAVRPVVLSAQVGHAPEHSPYHDIKRGSSLMLGVGYLAGGRGIVGVGPSNGPAFSARYELPVSRIVTFTADAGYARTTRLVADPTKDSASRVTGPVDEPLAIVDAGVDFMVTGLKTWHGFAPYVGAVGGMAISVSPPTDPSGYRFRVKGAFGPRLGMRVYPSRAFSVRVDARLLYWRLRYPLSYMQLSPDGTRVLPITGANTQWTLHPYVTLGLGWTF